MSRGRQCCVAQGVYKQSSACPFEERWARNGLPFNERAGLVGRQRTCRLVRPKTVECLRGSDGIQGIDRQFVELETMKGWSRRDVAFMMVSFGDNIGPACAKTTAPKNNPGLQC